MEYACFLEIQALWACDMSNLSECMCMCGVTRVSRVGASLPVPSSESDCLCVCARARVRDPVRPSLCLHSETQIESVCKFRCALVCLCVDGVRLRDECARPRDGATGLRRARDTHAVLSHSALIEVAEMRGGSP